MREQDRFIRCRTLGHSWDVLNVEDDGYQHLIFLRCTSCTTLRTDLVSSATGERIKPARYAHAKGYLRSRNDTDERPTKNEWRRQFIAVAVAANKKARGKR